MNRAPPHSARRRVLPWRCMSGRMGSGLCCPPMIPTGARGARMALNSRCASPRDGTRTSWRMRAIPPGSQAKVPLTGRSRWMPPHPCWRRSHPKASWPRTSGPLAATRSRSGTRTLMQGPCSSSTSAPMRTSRWSVRVTGTVWARTSTRQRWNAALCQARTAAPTSLRFLARMRLATSWSLPRASLPRRAPLLWMLPAPG